MAKGDWSAGCKLRPINTSFIFDDAIPPNIMTVAVQYNIMQPSGLQPLFNRAQPLAASVPIAQGLNAIQQAINEVLQFEGLQLG